MTTTNTPDPQQPTASGNGAELLVRTLLAGEVDVCFANPGTSEMHFVAALDRVPGMRCVLGLFEGVVTGAADGYYRMAGKPAATLLHLGPGLANGLANLHNAKKARSGVVNVVGDHGTAHLALDAPLTSDIAGLAAPMSHWVRSVPSADAVGDAAREAVVTANRRPGQVATLILPADAAWSRTEREVAPAFVPERGHGQDIEGAAVEAAVTAVRRGGSTLLLLGGRALMQDAARWAGRIAAATGCVPMSEFYGARIERGAGRVALPRLPYAVEPSLAVLAAFDRIVLVGAREPVAFFAYPDKPGRLSRPDCEFVQLAAPGQDPVLALQMLCEAIGAASTRFVTTPSATPAVPSGPITPDGLAAVIADVIPEGAIVIDEAITSGRGLDAATRGAAPHDWLTGSGGSIGFALPVALGAAIAAPGRPVIALEGDGSAMYTLQALWTMARESLPVTVVIFANRAYQILRGEFAGVGAGAPGRRATDMLTLDRPDLDWVSLARGMGVGAARVEDLAAFRARLAQGIASGGPSLIEVRL